eukprot:TRINITY_DN24424_c0_g1_i1.p1 TRINITY_DN24424_c0_g1~~TRINITY_DN24424_c0_g1_i1.p1  ORF type:complete len:575 (-),score=213.21 TRINITY_DN24424_c0_g1_i1:213-1937(-)
MCIRDRYMGIILWRKSQGYYQKAMKMKLLILAIAVSALWSGALAVKMEELSKAELKDQLNQGLAGTSSNGYTVNDVYKLLQGLERSERETLGSLKQERESQAETFAATVGQLRNTYEVQGKKCRVVQDELTEVDTKIQESADRSEWIKNRRAFITRQLRGMKGRRCEATILFVNTMKDYYLSLRALYAVRGFITTGKLEEPTALDPFAEDEARANATNATDNATAPAEGAPAGPADGSQPPADGAQPPAEGQAQPPAEGAPAEGQQQPPADPQNATAPAAGAAALLQYLAPLRALMTQRQLELLARFQAYQAPEAGAPQPNVTAEGNPAEQKPADGAPAAPAEGAPAAPAEGAPAAPAEGAPAAPAEGAPAEGGSRSAEEVGSGHIDNDRGAINVTDEAPPVRQLDEFGLKVVEIINEVATRIRTEIAVTQDREIQAAEDYLAFEDKLKEEREQLKQEAKTLKDLLEVIVPKRVVVNDELIDCRKEETAISEEIEKVEADAKVVDEEYAERLKKEEEVIASLQELVKIYFSNVQKEAAESKSLISSEEANFPEDAKFSRIGGTRVEDFSKGWDA